MVDIDAKTRIAIPLGAVAGIIAFAVVGLGWLDNHIRSVVKAELLADVSMKVLDLQYRLAAVESKGGNAPEED